jgi:hypothetical protein
MAFTEAAILHGLREILATETSGRVSGVLALTTSWAELRLSPQETELITAAVDRRFRVTLGQRLSGSTSVGETVARIQAQAD